MNNLNYKDYLSESEKKALENVNELSNNLEDDIKNNKNILNKTISEIINDWSDSQVEIMNELIELYSIMDNYDNYEHWWEYILYYYKETVSILLKKERIIYTGITILFICLLLYFITVSN